jgi:hypothetical protein
MLDDNYDWHEIAIVYLNLPIQSSLLANNLVQKHRGRPTETLTA